MMGYGSYGHGGFSSSSSNLSALAPPFTVSPKPNSSPLVDMTEPSYGVPLSSSLHNWLPSHYPNSGPGYFSNHNSEFNPMPSSNAFSYPGLQDIESPNTHLPPVNPSASASADAFLRGQCLDGVAASLVEDKRYHPTYAPPAIQDHDPLVAPDKTSYDCFSSSRVATLDGSSNNDYILPGSGYTADWGESWNRLGDWEHGKQVELEGSFCSKDIYKNYMNQGAHASKGLSAYEEASHIIDMLGWEKHGGSVSMERSNDKSFSGKNPRIMPVDYSKITSFMGPPSPLPENHPNEASSRSCQVPYNTSFEKHLRQHDASPRDGASFMTSSPSLVIRQPDIDTSFSAPNRGPLKDMNFGTDAADPDPYGNNPSNVNEFCPLLSSASKARFDTSQVSIHLDRNDRISVDSFSAENEKMSKDKSISEDVLDQVFKAKSALQISHTSSDGFNLALDFIEAINPVENSSESLDHYSPAVDSPCWKGAPVTCFSPFEASKAVNSHYMKKLESCNSSDFPMPQFFHLNIDDAVKLSSQNPNEKTDHVERGLRPNLKRPLDANSLFREPRLDDSAKAGSFHSKSSCCYEAQHSDNICEPEKGHALTRKPTDLVSNVVDFARYGSSNEPCHATENGLSSVSSVEDASSKLTKHEADSTPKIDVQILVNTMRSLSNVLLFHSSNDSLVLKEGDLEALKDVIFNLHRCIVKDNEQIIPTQESLFPQQGTSQDLEELPKLPKEVSVDRRRLRKEADVIAQDQLDHQCLHEEKHNDIGAGNKMEMASDSVSPKGDMAKEDNMTQAIMKVLSEHFDCEEETQSQSLLYKNLWLEAEAELCSINYKARYNRMKIEMEKSESHNAKENTLDVEEKLGSMASHDLDTVDKLAPETKAGPSPDISIQYTPPIQDVIARYGILKRRIDHNSATDVEELSSSKVYHDTDKVEKLASEATEAKCLTQDSSIRNSLIVSTTCHADDVMARFHILKRLVDNSNSVKATDVEEPSSSSVSPDLSKADKLAPEATGAMGTLIPDIFIQNSPISTTSCHTDDVEASVLARFSILKCRDDNLNSTDFERQELSEFDHLGFAGVGIHRPIIRDRSEDGSTDVKLGPVLQHHTASSTEDKLTVKEFHLHGDDPVIQSCPSNGLGDPLPAGWYDSTSSDWEHVMKEELVG